MTTTTEITRDGAIVAIRAALKRRSGKSWSVTGGRGTAWGWLHIDAPPGRRTWGYRRLPGRPDEPGPENWEYVDLGTPGHGSSPAELAELGELLGLGHPAHMQGESIPASHDHWREYIDRAEGRTPAKIAEQYWD